MDESSVGSFREQLQKKLSGLNETQHSVQTVSEWVMFHQSHSEDGIALWDEELRKAPQRRKLAFLFLCNDIIQNSRKKTTRFIDEFTRVLPVSLGHVYNFNGEDSKIQKRIRSSIERLVAVWADRALFPSEFIEKLREELEIEELPDPTKTKSSKTKSKVKKKKHTKSKKKDKKRSRKEKSKKTPKTQDDDDVAPASNHPVVKALIELENDAVEDAVVAVKVAGLTPEIPSMTSPVMVRKALDAFTKHRGRLQVNIRRRKQLLESLKECLKNQENLIARATQELEDCNSELNTLRTRISATDIIPLEDLVNVDDLPPNTGLPLESTSVGVVESKEDDTQDMDLDSELTLGEEQEQELQEQQRRQEQQPDLQESTSQYTSGSFGSEQEQQQQSSQQLPPSQSSSSELEYQIGHEFEGSDEIDHVAKRPKVSDTSVSELPSGSSELNSELTLQPFAYPHSPGSQSVFNPTQVSGSSAPPLPGSPLQSRSAISPPMRPLAPHIPQSFSQSVMDPTLAAEHRISDQVNMRTFPPSNYLGSADLDPTQALRTMPFSPSVDGHTSPYGVR